MKKFICYFNLMLLKLQFYFFIMNELFFIHLEYLLLHPFISLPSSLRQLAKVVEQEWELCVTIAFLLHSYHRLLALWETSFHS